MPGLLELRAHCDACAETAGRDPDALITAAVAAYQTFRASCSVGRVPALSPRKLLEHWPTVWELVEGKRPAGKPPSPANGRPNGAYATPPLRETTLERERLKRIREDYDQRRGAPREPARPRSNALPGDPVTVADILGPAEEVNAAAAAGGKANGA